MKKKLAYISYIAAPHQVKLCYALQQYFEAVFYFYDGLGERASWWKIDLGDKCQLLPNVRFKKRKKYFTFSHLKELRELNPDIVMLGGFSIPANYMAYLWARWHNKKTIIFTERSRDRAGNLRKRSLTWYILRYLYRNVDMVMVSAEDIVTQFRDEFKFGDKVVESRYASDIDHYFAHPERSAKEAYTFMYPNRLTDIYNPLGVLEIFKGIIEKYPASKLHMNALGELREECEQLIEKYSMGTAVHFLDNIESWDDLHKEYAKCDIMIFPAKFSNGNFTIVEAMASGMGIVISNKILGYGNFIEDGVNGFNCEPTKEAFIDNIEKYIANPELLKEHTKINRAKIKHMGASGTAELYHELIESLY